MEKLVVFNDYANVEGAYQKVGKAVDDAELLRYLTEGRFLVEAHAFVPIDPRNPHARDQVIEDLWSLGYLVHSKVGSFAGEHYRCDFDVEITLELMRTAEIVKPDIIVLMSGDKDFIPVIIELRRRGIRVEVAAFPGVNAAQESAMKCSGFIDLHRHLEESANRSHGDEFFAEQHRGKMYDPDEQEVGADEVVTFRKPAFEIPVPRVWEDDDDS